MNMTNVVAWMLTAGIVLMLATGCAAVPEGPERNKGVPDHTSASQSAIDAEGAAMAKNASESQKEKKLNQAVNKTRNADEPKVFTGTGVFVKPATPPITPEGDQGPDVVLNFEGADVREVIRNILSDIMGENYVIDPRVQGVVTIHSSRPIKRSAMLSVLETVLRMNGAVLVQDRNGVYKIAPTASALRGTVTPHVGKPGDSLPNGYSVQVLPLRFVAAREMAKILEPFLPEGGGVLRVDEARNLLIIGGAQRELRHLLDTIEIFDVDWISGMSVGLFPLQSADIKVVFPELEKIFGEKSSSPVAGLMRLVPIERLNALLVITSRPEYLEQTRLWVERLDRAGGAGGVRLYVYPVQNGKAEKMAALLNEIFGGKAAQKNVPAAAVAPGMVAAEIKSPEGGKVMDAAPTTPVVSGAPSGGGDGFAVPTSGVRVIADKDNNALLIMASVSQYESIESAIRKLDSAPRQVLIEVTIAEVTLTDELSYGLEWYFTNSQRQGGKLDTGASGISQLTPGFSYAWKDPVGNINAVLNALATDSRLNIISSPHIMVSDNQTAKIQVGDRVPTTSQSQTVTGTATGIISTVQYLDTGVLLSVTPHINAGGLVTMEINQEVSNASKTTTSNIDSPTISKRTAQSTVTVQSGETMVLGGLIKEEKNNSSAGVPLLSQVPVLGALFGNQTKKDNRTELIILITPRVAGSSQQAREITDEFRKKITGLSSWVRERTSAQ